MVVIRVKVVIKRRRRIPRFYREQGEKSSPEPAVRYVQLFSLQYLLISNLYRYVRSPERDQDHFKLDFNHPSNGNSPYTPHHDKLKLVGEFYCMYVYDICSTNNYTIAVIDYAPKFKSF